MNLLAAGCRFLLLLGLIALHGPASSAAILRFTDSASFAAFAAQGRIVGVGEFDHFGPGLSDPGANYTRESVTYQSALNRVIGTGFGIGDAHPLMSDGTGGPVVGHLNEDFTLIGFEWASTAGPVSITLSSHLGSHQFTETASAPGAHGLSFVGFATQAPGDHFHQFWVQGASGALAGITHVAVGYVTPVPEPSATSLAALSLVCVLIVGRRRKNSVALMVGRRAARS
jgi:hypothetical protein